MHTRWFLPDVGEVSPVFTGSVSGSVKSHVTLHAGDSAKMRLSRVNPLRGQPTMKQVEAYGAPATWAEYILHLQKELGPSVKEIQMVAGLKHRSGRLYPLTYASYRSLHHEHPIPASAVGTYPS